MPSTDFVAVIPTRTIPEAGSIKSAFNLPVESTKQRHEQNIYQCVAIYISATAQNTNRPFSSEGSYGGVTLSEITKVACQAPIREADARSSELWRAYDNAGAEGQRQRDIQDRQGHNFRDCINNLPPEILSQIFLLAAREGWERVSPPNILSRLAGVAKYWRDVVVSTPQLWSNVHPGMSSKALQQASRLSKGTPLSFYYPLWRTVVGERDLNNLFEQNLHRIQLLYCHKIPSTLITKLREAPAMTTLVLRGSRLDPSIKISDIPNVRALSIVRQPIEWATPSPHKGLITLRLIDIPTSSNISFVALLEVIKQSQSLETLTLDTVQLASQQADSGRDATPIELLELRSLCLKGLPLTAYNELLARLRFPCCTSVFLRPPIAPRNFAGVGLQRRGAMRCRKPENSQVIPL